MMGGIDRRSFIGGASALATLLPGCITPTRRSRWYKGMLHCHTYWSDGRGFPEDAVSVYKAQGYDFMSITDHNLIGRDRSCWRTVEEEEGSWPPKVCRKVFEHYRQTWPQAEVRSGADGKLQVRLRTFDEVRRQFEEPGRFLVMPGVEITQYMPGKNSRGIHVNCINLPEVLPFEAKAPLISEHPGLSVREMLRKDKDAYDALRMKYAGTPSLFFVNHPHWAVMDTVPDDLVVCSDVRFVEVCNNGSVFPVPKGLPDDGWGNDRFWDAVNASRARRRLPLLFGLASDDTHFYQNGRDGSPTESGSPGDGYIRVRAESLTPESLFAAMNRGDFHASSGVDLEDVSFADGTLSVSVVPKEGVSHTIRFIVSKRDFGEPRIVGTKAYPDDRTRVLALPGQGVGVTAKTVTGDRGKSVFASYRLKADDLYVRARIESDEPAFYSPVPSFHPKVRCAWTQPYEK